MTQIHAPGSTCRKAHERRIGALARLPKERPDMSEARKKSLTVELATLIERVALGAGYFAPVKRKNPRKQKKEDAS